MRLNARLNRRLAAAVLLAAAWGLPAPVAGAREPELAGPLRAGPAVAAAPTQSEAAVGAAQTLAERVGAAPCCAAAAEAAAGGWPAPAGAGGGAAGGDNDSGAFKAPAADPDPDYAMWSRMAFKEARKLYTLLDYQYLGRAPVAPGVDQRQFRFWVRRHKQEFPLIVTIRYNPVTKKVFSVHMEKEQRRGVPT
ncbi:DUF3889 domain-containing protein [Paenibacillus athensensis]|uniref:DUF3889 domain-containing protein n=1 Tax=Paenibacillus athensensis TaxID=1967502 RepID=A0A4Y8Q0R1_9BACL|nr:DUF3889 domain-containing protein [Paenibacillus athensensis]MCD1258267.1 DUF3889 domain-containing protein [Paenibacillus athensensis]